MSADADSWRRLADSLRVIARAATDHPERFEEPDINEKLMWVVELSQDLVEALREEGERRTLLLERLNAKCEARSVDLLLADMGFEVDQGIVWTPHEP